MSTKFLQSKIYFKNSQVCQDPNLFNINRIYHYTPEGTRESHPSVNDLQCTTRLAESWMSQIMDTRIGFLCPFQSVGIDYFAPAPLFSINNPTLMLF